mmetsp:Transcript_32731/g.79340  ORF Transcript_32731/g.79340 Transcript_32731/m.79340 type:complete len:94 (+) Transcript_32731:928-1209(+)
MNVNYHKRLTLRKQFFEEFKWTLEETSEIDWSFQGLPHHHSWGIPRNLSADLSLQGVWYFLLFQSNHQHDDLQPPIFDDQLLATRQIAQTSQG